MESQLCSILLSPQHIKKSVLEILVLKIYKDNYSFWNFWDILTAIFLIWSEGNVPPKVKINMHQVTNIIVDSF